MENELQKIDKILERLEGKSSTGYESLQRAHAVQKQRDNKVHNYDLMVTCTSHDFVNQGVYVHVWSCMVWSDIQGSGQSEFIVELLIILYSSIHVDHGNSCFSGTE